MSGARRRGYLSRRGEISFGRCMPNGQGEGWNGKPAEKKEDGKEKYSIFAVIGKSNRDLRRALMRDLGASGSRNLATLEGKIDGLAARLAALERLLRKRGTKAKT